MGELINIHSELQKVYSWGVFITLWW